MAKKANLNKLIKESIDLLKQYFDVKEVILFGSQLSGKADVFSDIDLIVVSPDFSHKTYEEIIQAFAEIAIKCGTRLEFHPYTMEEMKSARPTNFIGHVLKNSKTVFRNDRLLI